MLANAGVPMIALHLPAMIILLVPIVVVEALLARYMLAIPFSRSLRGITWANILSTLVGLPITWGLMLVLNIVSTGTYAKGLDSVCQKSG